MKSSQSGFQLTRKEAFHRRALAAPNSPRQRPEDEMLGGKQMTKDDDNDRVFSLDMGLGNKLNVYCMP